MNYEPNTIDWQIGDLVLHDADAKEPRMLMVVVGETDIPHQYMTIYVGQDDKQRREIMRATARINAPDAAIIWYNDKKYLHAPWVFIDKERMRNWLKNHVSHLKKVIDACQSAQQDIK